MSLVCVRRQCLDNVFLSRYSCMCSSKMYVYAYACILLTDAVIFIITIIIMSIATRNNE